MNFAHLHVHTHYSVLDGAADIKDLFKKAQADGQPALAITDHGNMFGVKEFLDVGKKFKDIKPIVGCEVYVSRGTRFEKRGKEDQSSYHLLLLAKNLNGYRNLSRLVSLGYIEGFHYKPRIDHELLEQYHDDLICSSACLAGEVPRAIAAGNIEEAERIASWYKDLFGDDFYLEIQRHETDVPGADREVFEAQQRVNGKIFEIAAKLGIKVIATNDVHFVSKEDGPAHDRLICLVTNSDYDDPGRLRYTQQEYLKSREEMASIFSDHPEVLENTIEICDKIERFSIDSAPIMPNFPIPEEYENSGDYLRYLTYLGAEKRYGEIDDTIRERIDFELDTIIRMGYPDYFLIVQDFIRAAREMDVSVGPGRGSAAGSVVAYCLKITDIDPLKYQLLFERFLNPERISMPDIDIDFDDEGRSKVLKYVEDKYGKDHVSHVITFGTMAAKSAIRDIARIQKLPLQESDRLAKMVPGRTFDALVEVEREDPEDPQKKTIVKERQEVKPTLKNCFKYIKEFREVLESNNPVVLDTLNYANKLEGTIRNTGVHACAILIGRENLMNYIPISTAKDKDTGEDIWVSQFEGSKIEQVGMLKMDFLGLKTLSIIKETINNIKKSKGITLNIDTIPLDDKQTFDLFCKGDTIGVFQFESDGMRKWLKELHPTRFEDLIAMNALYRPGPMDYIPDFVARKAGRKKIEYDLPEMEEILKETYGITVYQEQVMLLSQKIAGFTKGEADALRKAMGKKKIEDMLPLEKLFYDGGEKNGHPLDTLKKIWTDWTAFAQYAFNKSHSTCYAWIGYQTAYLKAHYRAEFMAASLSKVLGNIEEITKLMDDCKSSEMKVLGPDINESYTDFTVNKHGNIRFGMAGIKGVGQGAVNSIIEIRDQGGPFTDTFDFIERVNLTNINRKTLEGLVLSGAFDSFPEINRYSFFVETGIKDELFIDTLLRYGSKVQNDSLANTNTLFGSGDDIKPVRPPYPPIPEYNTLESLKTEKELVGMYLSAHPLDDFRFELEHFTTHSIAEASELPDLAMKNEWLASKEIIIGGLVTSVKNNVSKKSNRPWSQVTVEDYSGSIVFSLFGKEYENFMSYTREHQSILIRTTLTPRYPYLSQDEKERQKNDTKRAERVAESYELKISSITLLANAREQFIKEFIVLLPLSKLTAEFRSALKKHLKPGKKGVILSIYVYDEENDYMVEFFSRKYKIEPSQDFIKFITDWELGYKLGKQIHF